MDTVAGLKIWWLPAVFKLNHYPTRDDLSPHYECLLCGNCLWMTVLVPPLVTRSLVTEGHAGY